MEAKIENSFKLCSRTLLTEQNAPSNVTGVSAASVVNELDLVNINNIATGTPNVYNTLVQRVRNWMTPPQAVDDSTLLSATSTESPILLMASDVMGSPSVVGSVSLFL